MFPKFLRVVPSQCIERLVRINETASVWKKIAFFQDLQQLDVIAEALGFYYEVVFASDGEGYGERLPNGSWTKAMGMIQRREADLIFGSMEVTAERYDVFRLSYPLAVEEITFITKKHEYVPDPAVLLHIFSIQVWLSIIACICLIPIAFHFLLQRKHSAVDLFTSSLATLVAQGIELIPRRPREYFVLASWILGSSLLYYFYTSVLLSFLTFPSMEGIRTIEDLANGIRDGKYRCETYDNSAYADVLSNQQNSNLQVIGKELTEGLGFPYFGIYLETLEDRKPAYVGLRSKFLPYKNVYFISEDIFFSSFFAFATHKEFCCGSDLDKVMHRIWASGIFKKLSSDDNDFFFWYDLELNGEDWYNPPSEPQITMTMLKGPFIFLIVSHSIAFLVLLAEICIGKFKSL